MENFSINSIKGNPFNPCHYRELESIDKLKKSLNCVDCSYRHINTYLNSIEMKSKELEAEIFRIFRDFTSILMLKFGISFKHKSKKLLDVHLENMEKLENEKFKYNIKHPIQISFIYYLLGRYLGLVLNQYNKSTTCYFYGYLLEVLFIH
jgi:hypothetical protein